MIFAAVKLTVRISRRIGLRPWSREARALLWLIVITAKDSPNPAGRGLTRKQRVFQAAKQLAGSAMARESIADALEVSSLSAWTFQRDLDEWLRGSAA